MRYTALSSGAGPDTVAPVPTLVLARRWCAYLAGLALGAVTAVFAVVALVPGRARGAVA